MKKIASLRGLASSFVSFEALFENAFNLHLLFLDYFTLDDKRGWAGWCSGAAQPADRLATKTRADGRGKR